MIELVFYGLYLDLELVAVNLDPVVGFSDPAAVDLVADHLVAVLDLAVHLVIFLSSHCHGWWCC